jgi:hypothetical protein
VDEILPGDVDVDSSTSEEEKGGNGAGTPYHESSSSSTDKDGPQHSSSHHSNDDDYGDMRDFQQFRGENVTINSYIIGATVGKLDHQFELEENGPRIHFAHYTPKQHSDAAVSADETKLYNGLRVPRIHK